MQRFLSFISANDHYYSAGFQLFPNACFPDTEIHGIMDVCALSEVDKPYSFTTK